MYDSALGISAVSALFALFGVFTRLSMNACGGKGEGKGESFLIAMWWDCSIEKSDCYRPPFLFQEKKNETLLNRVQ